MPGRFVKKWSGYQQQTSVDVRVALEAAGAAWRALRTVEKRSIELREGKVLAAKHVASLKAADAALVQAQTQITITRAYIDKLLDAANQGSN